MAEALTRLGAVVRRHGTDWDVEPLRVPMDGPRNQEPISIDCGLAGTVMRFLPPVAALMARPVHVDGDPEARVRPMAPVLQALRDLGARVDDDGRGTLPFTLTGPALPSLPHIAMTVEVLRAAGVTVDDSRPYIWEVAPGPVSAREVRVEPDLSNAAPFLCAALVAGGTVRVPGWPEQTTQPGAVLPGLLTAMGGLARREGDTLAVSGTGVVHGIDVDLHDAGELAPTIAALAVLADSPTRLRGIGHIRGHETDRLAALATEIARVGGQAEQTHDGLVITPRPLHGAVWQTYRDHRMATAGALVGLRVPDVQVVDVATTAKTLPDFVGMWADMLSDS